MPKDAPRPRTGPKASGIRRTGLRRERTTFSERFRRALRSPDFGWAVIITLLFTLVCGTIAAWARERPLIAVGRVLDHTRTARVETSVPDPEATKAQRNFIRNQSPRIWEADEATIDSIIGSLRELPRTVSGVESAKDVKEEIRQQFGLTDERLSSVKQEAVNGEPSSAWLARVNSLREALFRRPIVERDVWQTVSQENWQRPIELRLGTRVLVPRASQQMVANVSDAAQLKEQMTQAAREANFSGAQLDVVVNRLTFRPRATYRQNTALTQAREDEEAAKVPETFRQMASGQTIYRRGETLTQQRLDDTRQEMRAYIQQHPLAAWVHRLSAVAGVGVIASAIAAYLGMFCERVRHNPERMAAIAVLLAGAFAVATWGTVVQPTGMAIFTTAPTAFAAIILAIVYDRRIGTAVGALLALMVCFALRLPISTGTTILAGIAIAAWNLAEIRDRRSIVRMSLWTAGGLASVMLLLGMADRPVVPGSFVETLWDAAMAGAAGLLAGGVTMFILPTIERAFDVTTGMTLIELRDPKHQLLRQLQQKAPGTYNHSLNVATIAESAADAIGADSLLTYVGGLYHDIGKMNKPEYFVENQSGGPNKHDKLSPAMSLLVIVGHVKDGVELAREFSLPRSIQHFIEAHHGTTLVEYFYHRAKSKVEAEKALTGGEAREADTPKEITYRYPGPKPQTKEVAILMLADAVEGATRTLAEPTPSRIDALVRDLANKRLMDGQFDECDLTLKDVKTIVDSISKTVASIYHGRIAYPGSEKRA